MTTLQPFQKRVPDCDAHVILPVTMKLLEDRMWHPINNPSEVYCRVGNREVSLHFKPGSVSKEGCRGCLNNTDQNQEIDTTITG